MNTKAKRCFRLIAVFLCLSVLIGTFAACNTAPEPSETSGDAGTSEEVTTGGDIQFVILPSLPLEPDKENLPSYADLCKIQAGMTTEEVYAIAGNPQREAMLRIPSTPWTSVAIDMPYHVYDSHDGESVYVRWMPQNLTADVWMVEEIIKSHDDKPLYSDLCSIQAGMAKDEVCLIAGSPQEERIEHYAENPDAPYGTDGKLRYVYRSIEGKLACIYFALDTDTVTVTKVILDGKDMGENKGEVTTEELKTPFEFPAVSDQARGLYEVIFDGSRFVDMPIIKKVEYGTFEKFHSNEPVSDANAPATFRVEWFGETYELPYYRSYSSSGSAQPKIHHYQNNGSIGVRVDAETGEILSYERFPYPKSLVTKEDYETLIQSILPSGYDLSAYDQKIVSTTVFDKVLGLESAQNAFLPADDTKEIIYTFRYSKTIAGQKTTDLISVTADYTRKCISIKLSDDGLEASAFSELVSDLETCDAVVFHSFKENIRDAVTVYSVEVGRRTLFMHEGVPYIEYQIIADCVNEEMPEVSTGAFPYYFFVRLK